MSRMLPCHVEGRARQCKTLQGCGRSGKSFLVSLRGVLQLVRTPACHAVVRGSSSVASVKLSFNVPQSKSRTPATRSGQSIGAMIANLRGAGLARLIARLDGGSYDVRLI